MKRALGRLGFTTAHLAKKNDVPCAGDTCREARIDVGEACKLTESNGYSFVSWKRVIGARSAGGTYFGTAAGK